jgi:hypothetical protein
MHNQPHTRTRCCLPPPPPNRVRSTHLQVGLACAQAHQLHALAHEPGRGLQDDVGALLVVQAAHKREQRHVRVDRQPQLRLQRCLARGLARLEVALVVAHGQVAVHRGVPVTVCGGRGRGRRRRRRRRRGSVPRAGGQAARSTHHATRGAPAPAHGVSTSAPRRPPAPPPPPPPPASHAAALTPRRCR